MQMRRIRDNESLVFITPAPAGPLEGYFGYLDAGVGRPEVAIGAEGLGWPSIPSSAGALSNANSIWTRQGCVIEWTGVKTRGCLLICCLLKSIKKMDLKPLQPTAAYILMNGQRARVMSSTFPFQDANPCKNDAPF